MKKCGSDSRPPGMCLRVRHGMLQMSLHKQLGHYQPRSVMCIANDITDLSCVLHTTADLDCLDTLSIIAYL